MKSKQINSLFHFVAGLAFLLVMGLLLPRQSQAQYAIRRSVFGNGGGIASGSGQRIHGTVGQPLPGMMSGATNRSYSGFWYTQRYIITGVSQELAREIPVEYRLYQNYPNPFNPTTTIRFALPKREHVSLKVFDILGREVATLVDGELNPGRHSVIFEARGLASGVYIAQFRAGKHVQRIKMMILK